MENKKQEKSGELKFTGVERQWSKINCWACSVIEPPPHALKLKFDNISNCMFGLAFGKQF